MGDIFSEIFSQTHGARGEPLPKIDEREFFKVLSTRRSVRRFTNKPIPEGALLQMLEAGLLAPTSSNLQQWEFHWVKSPEKRAAINNAFLNQPAVTTAAELVIAVARTGTWKKLSLEMVEELKKLYPPVPPSALLYYQKIVPLAYTVGPFGILGLFKKIVLFARGLFMPTPRECTSQEEVNIWAVKSTALACQNIMLTARALGFDSCPMEGMDSRRVRKILDLPSDALIVMGIALGERSPEGVYGPRFRFSKERFIKKV